MFIPGIHQIDKRKPFNLDIDHGWIMNAQTRGRTIKRRGLQRVHEVAFCGLGEVVMQEYLQYFLVISFGVGIIMMMFFEQILFFYACRCVPCVADVTRSKVSSTGLLLFRFLSVALLNRRYSFPCVCTLLCFDAIDVDGGVFRTLVRALQEPCAGVGKCRETASGDRERQYKGKHFCVCMLKQKICFFVCSMYVVAAVMTKSTLQVTTSRDAQVNVSLRRRLKQLTRISKRWS